MSKHIHHINPEGMMKSPVFSQVVMTKGSGKTIYIGGQNAVDSYGEAVTPGDLAQQTEQAMRNLLTALEACEASFKHVVKLNIYIVQGQDPGVAFQTAQQYMNSGATPPAITVLIVAGLANPGFLIEIDGIAFLPE